MCVIVICANKPIPMNQCYHSIFFPSISRIFVFENYAFLRYFIPFFLLLQALYICIVLRGPAGDKLPESLSAHSDYRDNIAWCGRQPAGMGEVWGGFGPGFFLMLVTIGGSGQLPPPRPRGVPLTFLLIFFPRTSEKFGNIDVECGAQGFEK